MAVSMYNISFKESFQRRTLCTNELEENEVMQLRHAVEDLYYFEFVYGGCALLGISMYFLKQKLILDPLCHDIAQNPSYEWLFLSASGLLCTGTSIFSLLKCNHPLYGRFLQPTFGGL